MDVSTEGARQLERAARLLDAGSSAPRGTRTPVHKSLEQLFGEARGRSQPHGALSATPFGPAGASRLLQGPRAQRLDREVADFSLGGGAAGAAGPDGGAPGEPGPEDRPGLSLREFFGLRHERVVVCAVEEAHRDCMRSFERRAFERFQADWEEAKCQILRTLAPQHLGPAAVGAALRGGLAGDHDAGAAATAAPPQDAAIIDLLLRGPTSQPLVQRIAGLSCESCPRYQEELAECWGIISYSLRPTLEAVTCGAITYLHGRFAEALRAVVHRSVDARLGGVPDSWALVRAFGRVRFETAAFPSTPAHVWYAAYVAARAGFAQLLLELPERSAPCSDRCPVLRTVCVKMARLLRAAALEAGGPAPPEFEAAADVDQADLLRADLAEEGNGFRSVLVSLLLGRSFAFGRLPEATVEDWLWFRLHALFVGAGEGERGCELLLQLEALRQHALTLPPSHYDPAAAAGVAVGGASSSAPNLHDGLLGGGPSGHPGAAGGVSSATAAGATQTLNFAKVLLLTAQFGRAIQQLRAQDRCLRGPALHMALVLQRAGTLEALEPPEQALSIPALVRDHARHFGSSDQLQYFRVLDLRDRVEALQDLLLRGGAGTNDELLGCIDASGRHRPGLLERTLHEDGLGDSAEFADLCARAGRSACERGQYREAIRLLHLGRCHSEVLQVLCRCLRLPIWREPSAAAADGEAALLGQDIQRFFCIYERNLDRYALSSHTWAVARKLYAARVFRTLCDQGRPEAALDVLDREQLLPLATEDVGGTEVESELLGECPRIISDYVQILHHAASQGTVNTAAMRARVRQLQSFLAAHTHRVTLDQHTTSALVSLALF